MADNTHKYGIRPVKGAYGGACHPKSVRKSVASGYQAQDDGSGFSIDLNVGDPVRILADGTVEIANTTEDVWGVITGFGNSYNASDGAMKPSNKLAGGGTWSGEEQRPFVYVVPAVPGQLFEIDVDDAVTATTKAAYFALIGLNAEHTIVGVSASATADPRLDVSSGATTATLGWRIEDVSMTTENVDFSGANVKLIVSCNISQHAAAPADASVKVGV